MPRSKRPGHGRVGVDADPHQLQIDWSPQQIAAAAPSPTQSVPSQAADPAPLQPVAAPPLVQRLQWDFRTSFPEPTQEAIDAGLIVEEEINPDKKKAVHEEHAREALAVLHDLDAVFDARRRGVDPATGKPPRTPASKQRLQKLFATEPNRLERCWDTLIGTYESVFGVEASDAFAKAVKAWHAGIEVVSDRPEPPAPVAKANGIAAENEQSNFVAKVDLPRRPIVARMPVPQPLAADVRAGHIVLDENGVVHRTADEVHAIKERHAY
jgi:hypothetical protein